MLRTLEQLGLSASLMLLTAAWPLRAQMQAAVVTPAGAGLAGTVRDGHGVPQMGVVVELLGAGVTATALTDLEGHYRFEVRPGLYQLRASATLYLPVIRRQLRLRAGAKPLVNLTMSGMFDEVSWLPIRQQSAGEGPDDWKWTLKSPVNRPMLHLVDDETPTIGEGAGRQRSETRGRVTVSDGSGAFGSSGERAGLSLAHRSGDGRLKSTLRSSMGVEPEGCGAGATRLETAVESGAGSAVRRRVSARVASFPAIQSGSGMGLTELTISAAERMEMGGIALLEAGNQTQMLRAGGSAIATHPFVRLSVRPGGGWTATYAMATSRSFAGFDDVEGMGEESAPVLLMNGRHAVAERGMHQELRVQRNLGRSRIEMAVHHDVEARPALSGSFAGRWPGPQDGGVGALGVAQITLDHSNGSFRTIGPAFSSDGFSVLSEVPVGDHLVFAGGYLNGVGLSGMAGGTGRLVSKRGQALLFSVQGRVSRTGTKVSTSYRWQPADVISVIGPYETGGSSPFLGVHLRQSLPSGGVLPAGTEVTIDGTNVLGEGYQRAGGMASDALLASALRELRGGISFTF